MKSHGLITESLCIPVTKMEMYRGEELLACARGFYIRNGVRCFLVTNNHVLTGRDNDTGKCSHSKLAVPDTVRCRLPTHYEDANSKLTGFRLSSRKFPLLDDDGMPLWLEHPIHGAAVDIAALIIETDTNMSAYALNDFEFQEFWSRPGQDALIIGFPFGALYTGDLPLWKHGLIATEPAMDFDGRPLFLVDSITHPGMSGSPVMARLPFGMWNRVG